MDVFDAAERYRQEGRKLIILAGKDYGSGSSRDWAAKGPWMQVNLKCIMVCSAENFVADQCCLCYAQGVKAVISESFERIHRSNLVGMGIMPLEYLPGQNAESLGLTGKEGYTIEVPEDMKTGQTLDVKVSNKNVSP